MCEVALVVRDTINTDFYLNCMCYKSGDVIDILPDGWNWGIQDLTNPNWRILKFPGIAVSAATNFITPQIPVDVNNPSKTLLRRAIKFDYTLVDQTNYAQTHPAQVQAFKNFILDDTRQLPFLTIPFSGPDIAKFAVTKGLVSDPTTIGIAPTTVIG